MKHVRLRGGEEAYFGAARLTRTRATSRGDPRGARKIDRSSAYARVLAKKGGPRGAAAVGARPHSLGWPARPCSTSGASSATRCVDGRGEHDGPSRRTSACFELESRRRRRAGRKDSTSRSGGPNESGGVSRRRDGARGSRWGAADSPGPAAAVLRERKTRTTRTAQRLWEKRVNAAASQLESHPALEDALRDPPPTPSASAGVARRLEVTARAHRRPDGPCRALAAARRAQRA